MDGWVDEKMAGRQQSVQLISGRCDTQASEPAESLVPQAYSEYSATQPYAGYSTIQPYSGYSTTQPYSGYSDDLRASAPSAAAPPSIVQHSGRTTTSGLAEGGRSGPHIAWP